jgi:hypothetical protein
MGYGRTKGFPAKCAKGDTKFRHGSWGYFQFSWLGGSDNPLILGVEEIWFVWVEGCEGV